MTLRAGGALTAAILAVAGTSVALASFAGDGYEVIDFGGTDSPRGVAVQKDGRIVAAGSTDFSTTLFDFATARFARDGDPDASFSGDAKQITEFGDFDAADAVAIQANGRIVVAGTFGIGAANDFAVVRYRRGGAPDTSFSNDGRQTTSFGEGANASDVAIQPNGRIVVVGSKGDDFAIVRYRESGRLDRSFSKDGRQTTSFGGFDDAQGVAIQRNGRIVVVGESCVGGGMDCRQDTVLARYTVKGKLDRSFSADGKRRASLGARDRAQDVAIQDNGRIVVAGTATKGLDSDFVVARFLPNGAADRPFGRKGKRRTDFGDSDVANALALQANGRIVLAGSTAATPTVDIALARYRANGNLDRSFSGDGKQTTDHANSGNTAEDIAFQTRRKFVVVGSSQADQSFIVYRYRNNGELDD